MSDDNMTGLGSSDIGRPDGNWNSNFASALDLTKYRDIIGSTDGCDADELLHILYAMMSAFVQNAWDVKIIPAFLPEIFADASTGDEGAVEFPNEEE